MSPLDLRFLEGLRLRAGTKGLPPLGEPIGLLDVGDRGWSLFDDLTPPVLILREEALEHNLALMSAFCREHGVLLAPHGKTTMAPQLWERQLDAGAWGITAATVMQAAVMRAVGVPRILLANELVDAGSIAWVAEQLADPSFELLCYVDSDRGVSILDEGLRRLSAPRPLRVLVELGHAGGRTGCRSAAEALGVATAVGGSDQLELAGVAGYEGTIGHERTPETLAAVGTYLDEVGDLARSLIVGGAFERDVVVTAGGSIYFDVVADRLRRAWPAGADVHVVLRSGCYLTHDDGVYERESPFAGRRDPSRRFRSAIEVWGAVLSRPEPDLALVGFGRRDVSFDSGPPTPLTVRTGRGESIEVAGRMAITRLNDQHAYCRVDHGLPVDVGDLVACGISHPCTALDKWRVIPVVDERSRVVEAVATFF